LSASLKRIESIQLKAAFLLIVFSLNMVVGFVCSVSAGMDFNSHHHEDQKATEVHAHSNGEKHPHEKEGHEQPHDEDKDNCCNDSVLKIAQADKVIPQAAKRVSPAFFTTFIATSYNPHISDPSQVSISNEYFVKWHPPPNSDTRIFIQSFQI
jgi:hypothetical protein